VNAIAPAVVKTQFFASIGERANQMFKDVAMFAPLRRNQTVEDIANAVAFLASDGSKDITGQCIQINSGLFML
jgi:3-oxoacyl-[acyl-carrier protein] reductase